MKVEQPSLQLATTHHTWSKRIVRPERLLILLRARVSPFIHEGRCGFVLSRRELPPRDIQDIHGMLSEKARLTCRETNVMPNLSLSSFSFMFLFPVVLPQVSMEYVSRGLRQISPSSRWGRWLTLRRLVPDSLILS